MFKGHTSLLILLSIVLISSTLACSSSFSDSHSDTASTGLEAKTDKKDPLAGFAGYEIYKKHCRLCHGKDGKKGLAGAKDLSMSTLDAEERMQIIRQGKGGMKGYQGELSGEEIREVAEFVGRFVTD